MARFFTKLGENTRVERLELIELNGLPALFIQQANKNPRAARRLVTMVELDESDRIRAIHAVLSARKLTAVNL